MDNISLPILTRTSLLGNEEGDTINGVVLGSVVLTGTGENGSVRLAISILDGFDILTVDFPYTSLQELQSEGIPVKSDIYLAGSWMIRSSLLESQDLRYFQLNDKKEGGVNVTKKFEEGEWKSIEEISLPIRMNTTSGDLGRKMRSMIDTYRTAILWAGPIAKTINKSAEFYGVPPEFLKEVAATLLIQAQKKGVL